MLQIECHSCKQKFWIKGYATRPSYDDPGEDVISEREDFSDCCEHIQKDGTFDIVDSQEDDFGDFMRDGYPKNDRDDY